MATVTPKNMTHRTVDVWTWFRGYPQFLDGMRDKKRGRWPSERTLRPLTDCLGYEAGRLFAARYPWITTKDMQQCIKVKWAPWEIHRCIGPFLDDWNSMCR